MLAQPDGRRSSCKAQGKGGHIDLSCPPGIAGLLTVQEHAWPGWTAEIDGLPTPLLHDDWIRLALPPGGQGRVRLRYRPWDASLGLVLAGLGWLWGLWLILRPSRRRRPARSPSGGPALG